MVEYSPKEKTKQTHIMKLNDKAQKTLDALFASGDGKHKAGGVVFGTTVIYNEGRANGMKFREIQETFMTDAVKVGYGKYDLYKLKKDAEWESASDQPVAKAAKKAAKKVTKKTEVSSVPMTEKQRIEKLIEESANWEVVYDSATDETLQRNW
jgi:hypothetical protein